MLNVLLVDDSVVIRRMLRRVLGECNLGITEIHDASNGAEALEMLAKTPIHLILSDVNMPVMGGLEFLKNLQGHPEWSSIPVIMVTTEGGQERVGHAMTLGAKGYICKPFTTDEVKQKLAEVLQARYKTMNVLLIDDSLVSRKMVRRILGECDLGITEILEAGDGKEALAVLETSPVQFMLCDLNMPVMDGFDFLKAVRNHPKWASIPVMIVTTEGGQETVMQAVELGAKGYIRKPFTPDEVKQKVSDCMRLNAA
jgi:two-component system chemotaxis response regulator CheY